MTFTTPCRFSFVASPAFEGFTDGTTWNGFTNVAVTPTVRDEIAEFFIQLDGGVNDTTNDLRNLPIGEDGLVSLANGWATEKEAAPMTLAIETFKPGQRVITTDWVDNYPVILCPAGEVGTVDEVVQEGDALRIMVKMDHYFADLAEWDNCLEVYVYAGDEVPLAATPDHEPVQLRFDSPSCAVAIAEAITVVAAKAQATYGTKESDRLMAVLGTLQAILMQQGCGEGEDRRLTQEMDDAIFG